MDALMHRIIVPTALALLALTASMNGVAQDTAPEGGSSQQAEESDESYRRRMELEDARRRDPGYVDPASGHQRDQEKIDKLPEESRDNIRNQLIDIIMENPEWEPGDALKEYPYEPTAAAQADADLMQAEQEAWDEQIQKYHEREAEAFGAYRGPVPGPGNPDGAQNVQTGGQDGGQQGQQGQGQQGGQGEEGQEGSRQAGEASANPAGTYEPYRSSGTSSEDAVSTAGVSESALDFLRSRQAAQQPGDSASTDAPSPPSASADDSASARASGSSAQSTQAAAAESPETEADRRGIIAIEDLDKLEGGILTAPPPPEEDEEDDGPN
jgi:hypothetical protein